MRSSFRAALLISADVGYYTNEAEFSKRVSEDALAFKPPGERIHTYNRPSPTAAGKGKGKDTTSDPNNENVVEFEVYHVRIVQLASVADAERLFRRLGARPASENTTASCNCSSYYTSRVVPTSTKTRIPGSLSYCA